MNSGSRRGRWLRLLALMAFVAGLAVIAFAIASQQHAAVPRPSAWGTVPSGPVPAGPSRAAQSSSSAPTTGQPGSTGSGPGEADHRRAGNGKQSPTGAPTTAAPRAALPASRPVAIKIPGIHVQSSVFPIGKDSHGGLQVPQPGPNQDKVAWYKYSPTPGQTGPAVLEGHVDTVQGPSVFLRLGALMPGDKIKIARADRSVAVFTVDAVRAYRSHNDFPTDLVYGGDLSRPTLRIITCSNFDSSIGHYVGNTIVFAHLVSHN